jgi:cytochrome c553
MRYIIMVALCLLFSQQVNAAESNDIFARPFSDGSPACVSCHSVTAAGYTASTWGPDISGLGEMLGEDVQGWTDFIKSSGIPAMDAVYAESTFTDKDIEGLVKAYAALQPAEQESTGREIIIYAAVLLAAMALMAKLVFRRSRSVESD